MGVSFDHKLIFFMHISYLKALGIIKSLKTFWILIVWYNSIVWNKIVLTKSNSIEIEQRKFIAMLNDTFFKIKSFDYKLMVDCFHSKTYSSCFLSFINIIVPIFTLRSHNLLYSLNSNLSTNKRCIHLLNTFNIDPLIRTPLITFQIFCSRKFNIGHTFG